MPTVRLIGNRARSFSIWVLALCLTIASTVFAQELEPRRWAQMPTGLNFAAVGYSYVDGEVFFDPSLPIEDTTYQKQSTALAYVRSLAVMGKSARVDFKLPYRANHWEAMLEDESVRYHKTGMGDARVRFSILLYGGPAETPRKFANSKKSNTVVGAAMAVTMPTGKYTDKHLFNLGSNRWIFNPQLGVTHTWGRWTAELTGSVDIYTDNDEFWSEIEYETDPFYALQAHLIYTFRPGLWISVSSGYGWGAEKTFDGVAKNDTSGNWPNALSLGVPIDRNQGMKFILARGRTQKTTGSNTNRLIMAYSFKF